jgi:hypothetical protein
MCDMERAGSEPALMQEIPMYQGFLSRAAVSISFTIAG